MKSGGSSRRSVWGAFGSGAGLVVFVALIVLFGAYAPAGAYTAELNSGTEEAEKRRTEEDAKKVREEKEAKEAVEKKIKEEQESTTKEARALRSEEPEIQAEFQRAEAEARLYNPPEPADPARIACAVPSLSGDSLRAAETALRGAHCKLGTVTMPHKHHGSLVVVAQNLEPGRTLAADAAVDVRLGVRGTRHGRSHH